MDWGFVEALEGFHIYRASFVLLNKRSPIRQRQQYSIIKFTDHYRFRENVGDPVASKQITLVHRRIKRKAGWFTEAGVTDRLLKFDYCLCDKNVEMIKP